VALMLGAGLSPGDVRHLKLEGVITAGGRKAGVPWKLAVEGNGNSPARETPIADWAGRQLAFWLRVRAEQGIPGNYVFPATMKGTQWSHSRCFESSRDVLESARLGEDAGGLYKLRHTFALRQLRKGKSEEDVARWLGLLDINGMVRYRRIVLSYQDVV
jgi:integrase